MHVIILQIQKTLSRLYDDIMMSIHHGGGGGGMGNKKDYDSFSEAQYIFDELSIRSSYHPSVQVNQSVLKYFSIL